MEEEKKTKKIPFPQANDVEKIITIIRTDEQKLLDNDFLMNTLNVTQRQINYYLSASTFLGVLDSKRHFTELGRSLTVKGNEGLVIALSKLIISKPVFCEVFFNKLFNGEYLSIDEISQMITIDYELDNVEVANRRASTVKKWVSWIFSHVNTNDLE